VSGGVGPVPGAAAGSQSIDSQLPDSPAAGWPPGAASPDGGLRWRVNSRLTVVKVAAAVLFLLAALLFAGDPIGLTIGVAAAVALGAFALRDLLAPVRLAADPTGVTVVRGFAGHRHLPWAQIERIRVDERRRFGTRSQLLEIDTGDSLHLFSAYELSAGCADVADQLRRCRESWGL
jgi:hypothetical protein